MLERKEHSAVIQMSGTVWVPGRAEEGGASALRPPAGLPSCHTQLLPTLATQQRPYSWLSQLLVPPHEARGPFYLVVLN